MRPRIQQAESTAPAAPGAFRADGTWDFDAHPPEDRKHTLHWFVDMLVTRRKRTPDAPPSLFVARIKASPYQHAFPNIERWLALETQVRGINERTFWPFVQTSTSAEECVKRCGNGSNGHWCGGYYARDPERDCASEGHRIKRNPERVQAIIDGVLQSLSDQKSLPPVQDHEQHDPTPTPPPDETWPGWKP